MADIPTIWDVALARGDWTFTPGEGAGTDLYTAALISVFTDAQASDDDIIPDGTVDRRGWWADAQMGSKLWLLARSKATSLIPPLAKSYIADALQWMIDDGVAARIDVLTEWETPSMLGGQITILRTDGATVSLNFSRLWETI